MKTEAEIKAKIAKLEDDIFLPYNYDSKVELEILRWVLNNDE